MSITVPTDPGTPTSQAAYHGETHPEILVQGENFYVVKHKSLDGRYNYLRLFIFNYMPELMGGEAVYPIKKGVCCVDVCTHDGGHAAPYILSLYPKNLASFGQYSVNQAPKEELNEALVRDGLCSLGREHTGTIDRLSPGGHLFEEHARYAGASRLGYSWRGNVEELAAKGFIPAKAGDVIKAFETLVQQEGFLKKDSNAQKAELETIMAPLHELVTQWRTLPASARSPSGPQR